LQCVLEGLRITFLSIFD